ncbi:hypothetical protein HGB25_02360 [Candidatus Saccharibacteria bacterium]|nr:hypothetical protein [Candidatus Saccharibacteria bacterium]
MTVIENTNPDESRYSLPRKSKNKKPLLILVVVLLVMASAGGWLVWNFINSTKDDSKSGKVITIKDLDDADVDLSEKTSDATVANLTKSLKAKIDRQIADKENPIDTVKELSGVLSGTTNQKRQDQLANFLEDFFANHEDALWLDNGGIPDQAQVNYWKGELYARLVFNFQRMAESNFTNATGKPIDTAKGQLKYIDLYLALAGDPNSHIVIPENAKEFLADYEYSHANTFLALKNDLIKGQRNG